MEQEQYKDLYDAYQNIEIEVETFGGDSTEFTDLYSDGSPHEGDEEDYGHYANYTDPDADDLEIVSTRFTSDVWDIEIPSEVMEELQEEFLRNKGGGLTSIEEYVWYSQWPNIRSKDIDPLQAAADYYLLFGIVNNAFIDYEPVYLPSFVELQTAGRKLRKSFKEIEQKQKDLEALAEGDPRSYLTNIKEEADKAFHALVEELDRSFREYVHLACGGELRHHSSIRPILSGYRKGSWVHWKYIFEKYGPSAIDKMVEMFLEFPDVAYGGPAWADAARILAQRERGELGPDSFTNKQLFVDRVFTLEHNGGCFLNKLNWVNLREHLDSPYDYHFECMSETVLELHSADVLDIDSMVKYASPEVAGLVTRYLDLARENDYSINGIWNEVDPEQEKITVVVPKEPKPTGLDWSSELKPLTVSKETADLMKQKMAQSFANNFFDSGKLGEFGGIPINVTNV